MFSFDTVDVPTPTEDAVRERLAMGVGVVVTGAPGSGKTHAVAKAVNGAAWSTVSTSPFAVPRVLADLAAALDRPTTDVLRTYAEDGCQAACARLDALLGERVVVVDAVERLRSPANADGFEEINTAVLWAEEREALRTWLVERLDHSPTVIVTRSRPPRLSTDAVIRHDAPSVWPWKLTWSGEGYLDWKTVADRLHRNPGAMTLAATALRLAGRSLLAGWLEETVDCGPDRATRELLTMVYEQAPHELVYALSVLHHAGETPRSALERLVEKDKRLALGLDLARELGLLAERANQVGMLPLLTWPSALDPAQVGAAPALEALCHELLADVNDRSSLDPGAARRVLDAHRIQLTLGHFDDALTTAHLHLAGLVDFARQQGLSAAAPAAYAAARDCYAAIRRLFDQHGHLGSRRVRSYVTHYHGFNGFRAKTVDLDAVARDYEEAVGLWPDNALWHARCVALAAEQADVKRARTYLKRAYQQVPDHPRREAFLRVRAARWADFGGAHLFALELLDGFRPSPELPWEDPKAAQIYQSFLRRWERGIEVEEIPTGDGRNVVFSRAPCVDVQQEDGDGGEWVAELRYPPARATGAGPWCALQSLARQLADDCRRLVGTPTARLTPKETRRKGLMLGIVDLAASVIGLPAPGTRWLLGTIDDRGRFTPRDDEFAALLIPEALTPESSSGLFFASVAIDGGGWPKGELERLLPAGSGRRVDELLAALRALSRGESA